MKDWDYASLAFANEMRSAGLDNLFMVITWLGSLLVLLPLAVVFWWWRRERRAAFVALALISSSAFVHILKLIVDRPRPDFFPPLIDMPLDASFPSAHAVQITAVAFAWLVQPGKSMRVFETAILMMVVAMVCSSRIYLQVHFPSDVVMGVLLAVIWVLCLRHLPFWQERVSCEKNLAGA